MKKQWCIPLLFLGVLCSAFPLEFQPMGILRTRERYLATLERRRSGFGDHDV